MAHDEPASSVRVIPAGTSDIVTAHLATAYMSYTRFDDLYVNGALTLFRERLNGEIRAQTGGAFHIFQSTQDIQWGQSTRDRLAQIINSVTFFIPVITPSYFNDETCRTELRLFLEREQALERQDLILPIYYLTIPALEDPSRLSDDPLIKAIADRLYVDWRDLRFETFDSPRARRLIATMAEQIRARMAEVQATQQSSAKPTLSETDAFDVFLCHNSADKPVVKHIGQQLIAQGIRPWLDEWEMRPGLPWQEALEQQIGKIKSAAVFVGQNGMGPWQNLEQQAFLRDFVLRKTPVIPVLLPNAPQKPELPVFLAGMMWVDFRKNDPDPLKQLIWGITGKRPA